MGEYHKIADAKAQAWIRQFNLICTRRAGNRATDEPVFYWIREIHLTSPYRHSLFSANGSIAVRGYRDKVFMILQSLGKDAKGREFWEGTINTHTNYPDGTHVFTKRLSEDTQL